MGGHPYWYTVDYQEDISAALNALRKREFVAGRYNPVTPYPDELPRFYHPLDLLFDYLPDADLVLEPEVDDRRAARFEQIADAHEGRRSLPASERRAVHIVPPNHLYSDEPEWRRHVDEGRRRIRRSTCR